MYIILQNLWLIWIHLQLCLAQDVVMVRVIYIDWMFNTSWINILWVTYHIYVGIKLLAWVYEYECFCIPQHKCTCTCRYHSLLMKALCGTWIQVFAHSVQSYVFYYNSFTCSIYGWFNSLLCLPQILQGMNLVIEPGQTVAIVGPSGNGKSTILQLIQQLYTPTYGQVTLYSCEQIVSIILHLCS